MGLRIVVWVAIIALAGCSNPLSKVDRLSDVDLQEGASAAGVATSADAEAPSLMNAIKTATTKAETTPEEVATDASPKRTGLFGVFRRKNRDADDGAEEFAALPPTAGGSRTDAAPRWGRRNRGNGPDAREIEFGTALPFGDVARVCRQPVRNLGTEVARYPEQGKGYSLIDSNPGAKGPRAFYLVGFKDRCARQFTAAMALFGTASMHESLRYGLPSDIQPYSETDKVYESVKARVCRTASQQPCGDRMEKLEKSTVFVSYYDRFGGGNRWANFLLYNGRLVAKDIKQ